MIWAMNIYKSNDLREILNEVMSEKKFLDKKFSFQSMAAFIRVQKPYLSKFMNNRADLNSDQMYMACQFLEMNEEETNYMLLLLAHERCTFSERKKSLKENIKKTQDSKIDNIKNVIKNISTRDALEFDNSKHIEYYLEPIISIVHMFLTIPRFRNNIDLIAQDLFISKEQLQDILKKLINMNIIEINDDQINILIRTLHLPKESKIISSHQQILKQNAIHRLSRIGIEQKKSFSVIFPSNETVRKKIEFEFSTFITKVRELQLEDENKEDCYQLSFDLFPWSNPVKF